MLICRSLDGSQLPLTSVTFAGLTVGSCSHGPHGVLQVPLVVHVGCHHASAHVGVPVGFAVDLLCPEVIVPVVLVGVDVVSVLARLDPLLGPGLHLPPLSLPERGPVPGLVTRGDPLHGGLGGQRGRSLTVGGGVRLRDRLSWSLDRRCRVLSLLVVVGRDAQLGVGPQGLGLVGDPGLVLWLDGLGPGELAVERVGGARPGPVVLAGIVDVVVAGDGAHTPRSRGLRLWLLVTHHDRARVLEGDSESGVTTV